MKLRIMAIAILVIAGSMLTARNARAAILVVTKTADTSDGVCDADCSLREAIAAASSGDQIAFSFLFNSPQTITLTSWLAISNDVSIYGPGASLLTIAGPPGNPLSVIESSFGGSSTVWLSGLTITGGTNGASTITATSLFRNAPSQGIQVCRSEGSKTRAS